MTLTEQWKKGELEAGWYYVQLIRGEYRIDLYIKDKNEWIDCPDAIIDAVVCAVPSYEEWLENESHCSVYSDINKWLKQENQQLKELLKEVRDAWVIYKPYDRNQLCKRIDNAIGEKNNGN